MALPRVSRVDKAAILQYGGDVAVGAPEKWAGGADCVPLLWKESKSVEFWTDLLSDFDIAAVCDLTPGAGALATVCLSIGVQ